MTLFGDLWPCEGIEGEGCKLAYGVMNMGRFYK